jgi:hypothetical protein
MILETCKTDSFVVCKNVLVFTKPLKTRFIFLLIHEEKFKDVEEIQECQVEHS